MRCCHAQTFTDVFIFVSAEPYSSAPRVQNEGIGVLECLWSWLTGLQSMHRDGLRFACVSVFLKYVCGGGEEGCAEKLSDRMGWVHGEHANVAILREYQKMRAVISHMDSSFGLCEILFLMSVSCKSRHLQMCSPGFICICRKLCVWCFLASAVF